MRDFRRDGFVILEGVIPEELVDGIVQQYAWLFDPATTFDVSPARQRVIQMDPSRRQDAWAVSDPIRELACLPAVMDLLRFFYQREPIPFQSLNFLRGTEQHVHSDAIHFNTIPAGFMCGVWVALEGVDEDNGPLVYYPGTQRLPDMRLDQLGVLAENSDTADGPNYRLYEGYLDAVLAQGGFEKRRLHVPKGSALIWASNLLHGGEAIRDPARTRMSQVTHYFFDGCTYVAPVGSDTALGEFRIKSVFDIAKHRYVEPALCGHPLSLAELPNGSHRIARRGELSFAALLGWQRILIAKRIDRFLRKRGLRGGMNPDGL